MAQKFSNAARAELSAPLSPGGTSLTLLSGGDLFPVANTGTNAISDSYDWFKVVVQDSYGYEIMYVRTHALNGLVLSNILRAQENTTALHFEAGTTVGLRPTAGDMHEAVNNRVKKVAGKGLSSEDYSSDEKAKLAAIATAATANAPDDQLRDRATHTGSQAIATVSGLQSALDAKQPLLVSGTNVKTINGQALLGDGDLAVGTQVYRLGYDSRASLRTLGYPGLEWALVDGLGLFAFEAGSTEPDDDETCFATPEGAWLLQCPAFDLVDAWMHVASAPLRDAVATLQTKAAPLRGSTTSSIATVAAGARVSFDVSIPGAVRSSSAMVSAPADLAAALLVQASVSALDTVTVYLSNPSAAAASVSTGEFQVTVI